MTRFILIQQTKPVHYELELSRPIAVNPMQWEIIDRHEDMVIARFASYDLANRVYNAITGKDDK